MTRHKPRVYDRHLPRGFGNLPPGNLPRGIPTTRSFTMNQCPEDTMSLHAISSYKTIKPTIYLLSDKWSLLLEARAPSLHIWGQKRAFIRG